MFDSSFSGEQRESIALQMLHDANDFEVTFLENMKARLSDPKPYDDEDFIQECITNGMSEVKGVYWYLVILGIIDRKEYNSRIRNFEYLAECVLDGDPNFRLTYHVW